MAEIQLTGRVYDIQGFSVQDGPGIRTTVFLKGCPLSCPWCHSPESQAFYPQLSWIAMRCPGIAKCGKCLNVCLKGALAPGKVIRHAVTQEDIQLVKIDRKLCDNCGHCARACYPDALYICGKDYTVEELMERVCKDIPFYEHSGGGVTISGGEALSQPEFTLAAMKGLKQRGINTALDTTGYANYKHIGAVLPYTDLFLYDLKHMDSTQHKKAVGVPNELILENARKIAADGGKLQVRIPVIPRFNDSEENIRTTGIFCRELGVAVASVQLLPYHTLGTVKYQRIAEERQVLEAAPPSDEKIQALKGVLEGFGLSVTVH
jgi:pyruvate formate lyase activating enzyme